MAEAIAAITHRAFAPADDQPTYVRDGSVKLQDLLRQNPHHADAVVRSVDVIAETSIQRTATASQWAVVEKLRATFPDATVTLMVQRLTSRIGSDAVECREVFVAVGLVIGPLTVRREFAV